LNYVPKTRPFDHQREELEAHWGDDVRALFWEMGTGKSKLVIDTAAMLHAEDKVDALLVVAPNGVHRNWIDNELPAHLPDRIPVRALFWESKRAGTKRHAEAFRELVLHEGLAVLTMSYDAVITPRGNKAAMDFLIKRTGLLVLDESTRIKTPGAARTKRILTLGKYAPFRRILTGTPVTNGPFDVYSQIRFLEPSFWRERHLDTFATFKSYFAVIESRENHQQRRMYDHVVAYRRLDQLQEMLKGISTRVTKDDVLNLPPKLYGERLFEPTPEQARIYEQLRDEYIVWLDSGEPVTADMAITRLLRLQQILCGYLPSDDFQDPEPAGRGPWGTSPCDLKEGNPRLGALMEVIEEMPAQRKGIIWARFRRDIDIIMDALTQSGERAVRYDGKVESDARAEAIRHFQEGDARFFVANPAAGGTGLTLTAATTVIYYSNDFNLENRLQSEDRAHRIGQEHPVQYIDIVAPGTVDRHIVRALRTKMNVASQITGDQLREWLR
jgi:SNF2 family DNA or RNA helicase